MNILIIDPTTTLDEDVGYYETLASPGTHVRIEGLCRGPGEVANFCDVAHAAPEIVHLVSTIGRDADAILINCFGDPALDAAREASCVPVVGPGETSMCVALQLGTRFSVVAVPEGNTEGWVRMQARRLGIEAKLASAIGLDLSAVQVAQAADEVVEQIAEVIEGTIDRDGADVIVLGCTAMARVIAKLRQRLKTDVPIIEPSGTAFKMAEMLGCLGLRHMHGRFYLPFDPENITGYPSCEGGGAPTDLTE